MYNRQEASCSGRYQLVWMTLFTLTHKAEGVRRNQRDRGLRMRNTKPPSCEDSASMTISVSSPLLLSCATVVITVPRTSTGPWEWWLREQKQTRPSPGVYEGLCSWDELAQWQLSFLNLSTMDNWGWGPSIWPTDLTPTSGLSWPCSPLWAFGFIWLQHSCYPVYRTGTAGERFIPLSSTPFLGILVHQ